MTYHNTLAHKGNQLRKHKSRNKKHGMSKTPVYKSWKGMKERTMNKNNRKYKSYGARGIKVCDRWINSFEHFYADMGDKPSRKHSIDRVDNDGDYSPDNCKWSTPKEQARNRRDNVMLTKDGKTMCLIEWAEKTGLSYHMMKKRIYRGWSDERVLAEPHQGELL